MKTMTEKQRIESFLAQKNVAVVGYSRNPKKFGAVVFKTLATKGYNLFAVNPAGGSTPDGEMVYATISELPAEVTAVVILTKPEQTNSEVTKAIGRGINHIWVQQMSQDKDTIPMLENSGVVYVAKRCILMHSNPSGLHKFHRSLAKLFGLLPK
jgi:predicted CoA-binding protein